MLPNATVERVLRSVAPAISVDRELVAGLLASPPTPERILMMLSEASPSQARAAVVYLGVCGTIEDAPVLALCLRHPDEGVARLAEHCLWGLWMRAGSEEGNCSLAEAVAAIRDNRVVYAVVLLERLTRLEPDFAEAWFQLGVARALLDQPELAASAYRRALEFNPYHFAAAASLGHAEVELGRLPDALHNYRRAVDIHPRLEGVQELIDELEARVRPRSDAG